MAATTAETAERASLAKIDQFLTQVRTSIDPHVSIQVVHALIKVALNEGKTLSELAQLLGTNLSSTSRNLLDLGERNRKMEPGHGLVAVHIHPTNMREKHHSLTRRGKLLTGMLAKVFED